MGQAQKLGKSVGVDDGDDDELGEDSMLLESPLDKLEPYQLFRNTILSKLVSLQFLNPRTCKDLFWF